MDYPSVKEENKAVQRPFRTVAEAVIDHRLRPHEEIWVVLNPFLLSRGYTLRPRYQPEWVPSWTGDSDKLAAYYSEDGIASVSDE